MLKSRNWRIFVIYLICRTDFGMIGCENHSNAKTELAFDRKYRGHVHLAELVFQSKQTTYCFDFCWLYFNFKIILMTKKCSSLFLLFIKSGYFFDEYLQYITLNNQSVEFTKMDQTNLLKVCLDLEWVFWLLTKNCLTKNYYFPILFDSKIMIASFWDLYTHARW